MRTGVKAGLIFNQNVSLREDPIARLALVIGVHEAGRAEALRYTPLMSPDLRVMLFPSSAYRTLAPLAAGTTLHAALGRPLLVAIILGCAMAISATGRITIGLALSTILCWSFVPALQMLTGAWMLTRGTGDPKTAAQMDLWFMGHAPWSLWILVSAAMFTWSGETTRLEWFVVASALIPAVWTGIITRAFCRIVQQAPMRSAVRRAIAHQIVTVALVVAYLFAVARPWARILEMVRL